jgi:septum formation protein
MNHPTLILASSSRYRQELLARLRVDFASLTPNIDESPLPNELPLETSLRLAEEKARAIAHSHPAALIIGSDQVAVCDGQRLDKPGHHAGAVAQLSRASGRIVIFHTAVVLLNVASGNLQTAVTPTEVRFRSISIAEIEAYLQQEAAYDCAGSAKVEGLGIALMEEIRSTDPTALVGLPLIALAAMLRAEGLDPLGSDLTREAT